MLSTSVPWQWGVAPVPYASAPPVTTVSSYIYLVM